MTYIAKSFGGLVLAAMASLSLAGEQAPSPSASAARAATPTFTRDIAPLFYKRCVTCHRPGEVAPMPLITYEQVMPWAAVIRDRVVSRAMPPWHADPAHGKFRNDLSLSTAEINTISAWATGGTPRGEGSPPPVPQFPEGWQIGTPDAVFQMRREFQVPANGTIDYQYFEVPTNFNEDRWLQAGEIRAGDRAHVHHIIVYVRTPKRLRRPDVVLIRRFSPVPSSGGGRASTGQAVAPSEADHTVHRGGDSMLVGWALGEDAPIFPPGVAKRIPAGSTLIFQVHYMANGTPGRDRSRIGLIFAKEPPQRELRTGMIDNRNFEIPPGDPNYEVSAEAKFADDVRIWTLHPHMHLRGKDMTVTATYPDGRRQILLRVPNYNFGWQTDYWLAEPLALPRGSTLHVRAHFDNSAANPANPDPAVPVRWGDQTWDEMMIGFFTYSVEGAGARGRASR